MNNPFPPPNIKPFQRLQVQDGLLMNAERWKQAHDYHRQRQNVHYQALNLPGIVCDLGVTLISPPSEIEAKYRDKRWVQVQPGIAIDLFGNIIVVPEPINFRISSENLSPDPIIVYLVVSYVDPEKLRRKELSEMVQETFRIDEKTSPPGDLEVELCRILLQPGAKEIESPKDVFFPGLNSLDLRYRKQARSRPQNYVRIAQIIADDPHPDRTLSNFHYLLESVNALYPNLETADTLDRVTLPTTDPQVLNYDVLFLTGKQPLVVSEFAKIIEPYLNLGTLLLIEADPSDIAFIESIVELSDTLGTPIQELNRLDLRHPLRTQPFLFATPPTIEGKPVHFGYGGGLILLIGKLSAAWGLNHPSLLPRETIRTAQELGINILNFAWRRRQMMNLLIQRNRSSLASPKSEAAKLSKRDSLFDKLV